MKREVYQASNLMKSRDKHSSNETATTSFKFTESWHYETS